MEDVIALDERAATAADLVGPKAATLARLRRAGLPVPDGFCVAAAAYRAHLEAAGLAAAARRVAGAEGHERRRLALEVRLGLLRAPLDPALAGGLDTAWGALIAGPPGLAAVRSSALLEDTAAASFAGQLDSYLGVDTRDDLVTALRGCWAALWAARALRYLAACGIDPAATAMAVLVQRLVVARASGGALSRTVGGGVLLTGAWGLGPAVAQGEVVPDRFVVHPDGAVAVEPGRKDRLVACAPGTGPRPRAVPAERVDAPCLDERRAVELAGLVTAVERLLGGPVEVEWALGERGLEILQARPLPVGPAPVADEVRCRQPGLRGQPAGVGWGCGPAAIVLTEHDLEHVRPGDVVVTQVAGPALAAVLPRAAAVVAELGGSTSHLAALARERGIPAVLGVVGATRRIPAGATVAVDGMAGLVHWTR